MEQDQQERLIRLKNLALSHKRDRDIKHYTQEQKLMIAEAYLLDHVPMTQLSKEFDVSRISIWKWINSFAHANEPMETAQNGDVKKNDSIPMSKKAEMAREIPEEELERLRQKNSRLKEALKISEWTNHAKDVMIDLAEQTFNIPIRKNLVPNSERACRREGQRSVDWPYPETD